MHHRTLARRCREFWREPAADGGTSRFFLLDGLRGLAALAILFWHYQHFFVPLGMRAAIPEYRSLQPFPILLRPFYLYGDAAVPVFWLISGFVFCAVYAGRDVTTGSFVVNRVARLYPLHLVTLIVVLMLQVIATARFGTSLLYGNTDPYHFALQILLASGWGFERGPSYNGPIWSVSAEVLVYAVFWLLHRRLLSRGIAFPLLAIGCFGALTLVQHWKPIGYCGMFFFAGCTLYVTFGAFGRVGSACRCCRVP